MEEFGKNLTNWTQNDIEIKNLQKKINDIKQTNKLLSENLFEHINSNDLSGNIFKITSLNKDVTVKKTKVNDSLTFKFLECMLLEYFTKNNDKSNEYHSENILNYIKENRQFSIKFNLSLI
tara:strand:- start:136 stop:498 length:363 start_codon:yes stop_codon:yes gene_type:complete